MSQSITTVQLLIWLVLLTPLASFLLCLLIPDRYSWLVTIMAPLFLFLSASLSLYLFFTTSLNFSISIKLEWFQVAQHMFSANMELNQLSMLMLPLVTGISLLVHIYSVGYMAGDPGIKGYFAMLSFFTFAMLGIVLSDNLVLLFVFWELVGFSSYMLIGHWMKKPAGAQAAKKAFIFNRIGDAGFLIGLMIVWANTQTLNLDELLIQPIDTWQTAAALFIFCGVVGKSAQLPLMTWLPDAMEGPTPVSALIHAATMVAAGVFLLARIFPLFTPVALTVVTITGSATALIAAFCALNQFDIKKILAYSTISQLGLMITAIGVGSKNTAMLHLFTHAFFKAGLFLAVGSVLHSLLHAQHQVRENFDAQDIRNLGGLRRALPFTFVAFLITGASLAGIPFLSGFISKDSILTSIWFWAGDSVSWKWLVLITSFTISVVTVLYTFRMIWYIFFAGENKRSMVITEAPWIMRTPLLVLAVASCWFLLSPNPLASDGWFTSRMGVVQHSNFVTLLSSGLILGALVAAWFLYTPAGTTVKSISAFQKGLGLDILYEKLFSRTFLKLASATDSTDRRWINGFLHFTAYANVSFAHVIAWCDHYIIDGSVNATAWLAGTVGSLTRSLQGGRIQFYIFWAIVGVIIFLFFTLI